MPNNNSDFCTIKCLSRKEEHLGYQYYTRDIDTIKRGQSYGEPVYVQFAVGCEYKREDINSLDSDSIHPETLRSYQLVLYSLSNQITELIDDISIEENKSISIDILNGNSACFISIGKKTLNYYFTKDKEVISEKEGININRYNCIELNKTLQAYFNKSFFVKYYQAKGQMFFQVDA